MNQTFTGVHTFYFEVTNQNHIPFLFWLQWFEGMPIYSFHVFCYFVCFSSTCYIATSKTLDSYIQPNRNRPSGEFIALMLKNAPPSSYLHVSDVIKEFVPARKLRSMDSNQLQMSKTNTKYYGDRALSVIAPTMWNSLPSHIRNGALRVLSKHLKLMCSSNM